MKMLPQAGSQDSAVELEECQTGVWKGCGLEFGTGVEGYFLLLTLTLVSTPPLVLPQQHLTLVSTPPPVLPQQRFKDSRSFCQKWGWRVTAKHTRTLCLWLWMKWHCKLVHGHMVYTECVPRRQQFYVAPAVQQYSAVSQPLQWIQRSETRVTATVLAF